MLWPMEVPPRKIALFGGTFDPVHLGHIYLAKLAKDALDLDEVRFLPCQISPHKLGHPASGPDRLEMLRRATARLPWAVIDDFELQREGPSFSFLTAEAMHQEFPDSQLFWIMGGDQWDALPSWKNAPRLAELVEFIVIGRGDEPQPCDGYRLHVVLGNHPASASVIREQIAQATTTQWLEPAVLNWIQQRQLYQTA